MMVMVVTVAVVTVVRC